MVQPRRLPLFRIAPSRQNPGPAYDRQTHAFIRNMPPASRSSQIPELQRNADGSIDVRFGPQAIRKVVRPGRPSGHNHERPRYATTSEIFFGPCLWAVSSQVPVVRHYRRLFGFRHDGLKGRGVLHHRTIQKDRLR
jgi:hypothetical protein